MMKRIGKIVARGRGSSQCQEGLTEMIIMTICDDKKHLLEYQQLPPPHGGPALVSIGSWEELWFLVVDTSTPPFHSRCCPHQCNQHIVSRLRALVIGVATKPGGEGWDKKEGIDV